MHILETLFPIFAVMGLGVALRAGGFAPASLFKETNRLVYWVGLPCLLLAKVAKPSSDPTAALRVTLVLLIGMLTCVALGYGLSWIMRLPGPSRGAFVQGAFRGNLAYVGLPVVLFASLTGGTKSELEAMAVLAIAPMIPVYNVGAVMALLAGSHEPGASRLARWKRLGIGVLTNPLVLSCVAGLALARLGIVLPAMVDRTLLAVGQMALPLALLGIGATLTFRTIHGKAASAVAAALIKTAIGPAAGWFVGRALGLDPAQLRIAMLYLACPTAVMSYVMAEQLGGDAELTAGIVLVSTLCAMPALAIVLGVTG